MMPGLHQMVHHQSNNDPHGGGSRPSNNSPDDGGGGNGSSRAAMRDRARRWRRDGGAVRGGRGDETRGRNDNNRDAAAIAVDRFESSMSGWDDCAVGGGGGGGDFDGDFVVSPGTPRDDRCDSGSHVGGGGGGVSGGRNSGARQRRPREREQQRPQRQGQFVAVAYSDRIEVPSPPPPTSTRTPSPRPRGPGGGGDGPRSPDISWGQEEPPSPVMPEPPSPVVPSWQRHERRQHRQRPQDQAQTQPRPQDQAQSRAQRAANYPRGPGGRASPTSPFDESPLERHGKRAEVVASHHHGCHDRHDDDYDDDQYDQWQHDDGISNVSSSYVVREIPPEEEDEEEVAVEVEVEVEVMERRAGDRRQPRRQQAKRSDGGGGGGGKVGSVLASPPPGHRPDDGNNSESGGVGGNAMHPAGPTAPSGGGGGGGGGARGKVAALAHMFSSRAVVKGADGGGGGGGGGGPGPPSRPGSAEGTPTQRHDVRKRWAAGSGDSSASPRPDDGVPIAGDHNRHRFSTAIAGNRSRNGSGNGNSNNNNNNNNNTKNDNSRSAPSPTSARKTMRSVSILNATNDSSTSGGTTNGTCSFESSLSSTDVGSRPSPTHEAAAADSSPSNVGWPGTGDNDAACMEGVGTVRMPSARITVTNTTTASGRAAPPPRPPASGKSAPGGGDLGRRSSSSSPPPDLAAAHTSSSYTTGSSTGGGAGGDTSNSWDEASGDGSFAHAIAVPDTTFELSTSAILGGEASSSSSRRGAPEAREKIEIIPSLASISAMGTGGGGGGARVGAARHQQQQPQLPPRSSLSKFRGGPSSPTADPSSAHDPGPGADKSEESSDDVGYSSFRTGPGGVSTSHSSGGSGGEQQRHRRNASASSPSYASFDTSPSLERSIEALETSSGIDISGSHRRVVSSGRMSGALTDHILRRSSYESFPPPADSDAGDGKREGGEEEEEAAAIGDDHTPTEEALALQDSFSALPRPGNAMNVRGFSGFINKTADVPNLMDDEDETEGEESGETTLTPTTPASTVDEDGFPTQESSSSRRLGRLGAGMGGNGNNIGEDTTFVSQLTEEVETTTTNDEGAESDIFDGLSEVAGGGGAGGGDDDDGGGGPGQRRSRRDDVHVESNGATGGDVGGGGGFAAARAKFMRDAPAAGGWGGRGSARDQFLNGSSTASHSKEAAANMESRQSPQLENRSESANSAVVAGANAVQKRQLQSGGVGRRSALRPVPKVSQQRGSDNTVTGTASSAAGETGGLRPGGHSTSSKIRDKVSIFDKNTKHSQPQPPSPSPSGPTMQPRTLFNDANVPIHDSDVNGGGNANSNISAGDDSSTHPEEEDEQWIDLSEYYVDPDDARKLVRRYRKLCSRFGGGHGDADEDDDEEDAKKAFALFEMRSRIMETDIERGLARRGGTAPVDDIVLTASNLATLRVRDAIIVSKAWRDGASPADVTTASLLTRRDTHSYRVRRTVVDRTRRRVSVHMEERGWLDDVDVLNYRCASSLDGSQAGTCMRGFDIFTVGDCQSLLLKLANERCMQLRKELERATRLQLEAEKDMNDEEENRENMYGSSRVSDAEMIYIRAAEEVTTITQSLVRAEQSFELVRDRIARLIAKYESRLVQMEDEEGSYYGSEDDDFSGSYSDGSYYDEYDDTEGESDGDWEKEELAIRAEEAEHRAQEASREAVQAKEEAERIRVEKQRELEALQNRLAELEQKSVLERQRSEDLVNKYEQQLEAERQSAIEKQSSFSAGNGNPLDKSDARSLLQSAIGGKDQEKIDSLKEKFRARHAQRGTGRRGPPTNVRRPPGAGAAATAGRSPANAGKPGGGSRVSQHYTSPHRGSGGDARMSPRRRNVGEEMFQHIDFYERSLQAVENRY